MQRIVRTYNKQRLILFFKVPSKIILAIACMLMLNVFANGNNNQAVNMHEWASVWHKADLCTREKMVIDFFHYAFQPVAPHRSAVLARLKQLQSIACNSSWSMHDHELQKALEKIVNDEVILIDAALGMNIPEWCGTRASRYLTGDNIAFLCSHRTFKVNGYSSYFVSFDPVQVKAGDSVFVVTNYLDLFFDVYHKQIMCPYVLVTDNSDFPVPGKFGKFLDDEKILAWFCINPDGTQHAKLCPIPLGIRNHGYGLESIDFMDHVLPYRALAKKNLLYLNFTDHNEERHQAIGALKNKSWCTVASNRSQADYYKDVAQSKFVLSPRGDGLDCWRTWETLLLGSYPIVKHSPLDSLFFEFPVVLVDDWADITEELLQTKYAEFSQKNFDDNKLFAAYWGNRINSFPKR